MCLTRCDPLWYSSPPGSSVHGILQARILEWVAILQRIFLIQGLNSGLHGSQIIYLLSHQGSPYDFSSNCNLLIILNFSLEASPGPLIIVHQYYLKFPHWLISQYMDFPQSVTTPHFRGVNFEGLILASFPLLLH